VATISFDLDGVLIQNPFGKGVIPRVRTHIRTSSRLSDLPVDEADELINAAIREAWSARMRSGDFVAAYDWDSVYAEVCRGFGGDGVPDVATLVSQCCTEDGLIGLLPGAEQCLDELLSRGYDLAAATNGFHAYQWPVLEALGIADRFSRVLSPDITGHAKPSPEYFSGLTDLVAHVGDTLEHDVLGANLAGVGSVWLAAELPDSIRSVEPWRRTALLEFVEYHRRAREGALYRRFHEGAPNHAYLPDLVAATVSEVPQLIARLEPSGSRV
jgi:putative hydrolase of the HAD superfamily